MNTIVVLIKINTCDISTVGNLNDTVGMQYYLD